MTFDVYYQNKLGGNLRHVRAAQPTHDKAIEDVLGALLEENEQYVKPLLAVIKGGKS